MSWRLLVSCVVVSGFLAGCADSVPPAPPMSGPVVAPTQPPAAEPNGHPAAAKGGLTPEKVKLVTGDEKKLAEMIARHKGDVVFVDYWATWCEPCVEYFPHTVAMDKQHRRAGLRTIGVTFDAPEDEKVVREFLATQGADFENLLSSYPQGPDAFVGFDLVTVPTFRLYDRKGVKRYEWAEKPKDAEEKIGELLGEPVE
jgi:thiol-disulfide isomerase/thioredoxin